MKAGRHLAPLAVALSIAALLAVGLSLDVSKVDSPLVSLKLPSFALPSLNGKGMVSPEQFRGRVWVLNVWASWCLSCRVEHQALMEMARNGVTIVGLNYKDREEDAKRWLAERGDPYAASAVDADGRVGVDLGVYGVPESFVIHPDGTVLYKLVGPIKSIESREELLAAVAEAGN